MVENKVAWLLDERKRGFRDFAKAVLHAINHPEELIEMSKHTKNLARPDAVVRIADMIESLVKEKYQIASYGEEEKNNE
jgi:UDP-N-acetylglucosamine:LPS N-acetylglucosamine transferase